MAGFVMIPDEVRLDERVSAHALRVYATLSAQARASKTQQCKPIGIRLLARLSVCSVPTAQEAVKSLTELGYIAASSVARGERTVYTMTSKWFVPAKLRKKTAEEVLFSADGLKLTRQKPKRVYAPTTYTFREETA